MTDIIVPVGDGMIRSVMSDTVFETSHDTDVSDNLQKLSSPAVIVAAKEAWSKITHLLESAATYGWEKAQEELELVTAFVEECSAELMAEAEQMKKLLVEKLHEAMQEMVNFILGSLRSRLTIGTDQYILDTIDLQTTLIFSGSLQASLASLCKFLASGETAVTGSYSRLKDS